MKQLLIAFLLFFALKAKATNYYFSSSGGDDARSSLQAQNLATPWKSLDKLNSFFINLQPGDSVLFKRGDVFYGSITINKSGTSTLPIIFSDYGTGLKPVICGFTKIIKWSHIGGGIYESDPIAGAGSSINMVTIDNVPMAMGRYPNSNDINGGYMTFESSLSNTSITDNQLTSSPNWTGAEIVVRKTHYTIDRHTITAHSGTTISYDNSNSSGSSPQNNWGYFIQNDIKTLDNIGEWYYNPSTKKISMFFGANAPGAYAVKIATIDYLVTHGWMAHDITFNNIAFVGANKNGLRLYGGTRFKLSSCDVNFSGADGVFVADHTYFDIQNSTVINCNYTGIRVEYGVNTHATIRNNVVRNIFTFPGMIEKPDYGGGIGIMCLASNSIVEYNEVHNSGGFGIYFRKDNVTIKNNIVDSFGIVKDDVGGIYTNGERALINTGRLVIGNVISNGIGAKNGTYDQFDPNYLPTEGIYMDENANGVIVTRNTTFNISGAGYVIHKSHHITLRDNTAFNNRKGLLIQDDVSGQTRSNIINNNIFFAKTYTQLASSFMTSANDISLFGTLDSNYYCRPLFEPNGINSTSSTAGGNVQVFVTGFRYHSLDTWKTLYGKDTRSNKSAITVSDTSKVRFEYNATKVNKTIILDNYRYLGIDSTIYSGSVTLAPYTSIILLQTGVSNVAPEVNLISPETNTFTGAPASISLEAAATDKDGTIFKVEFYNGTTRLASVGTKPYIYNWNNVAPGNYHLFAKAIDNGGLVTSSDSIAVSVIKTNTSPTVSLTSPSAGANFLIPASINMSATAGDSDGSVTKVEFFNGSILLSSDTTSPYNFTWNNVGAGVYTITAKASDNNGATSISAPVTMQVSTNPEFVFTSFSGKSADKSVTLFWQTNNPGHTKFFRVQRRKNSTKNSTSFADIGTVSYLNSSLTSLNYSFIDPTPYVGRNYYRIICVDSFGQTITSDILLVTYSTKSNLTALGIEVDLGILDTNSLMPSLKLAPNPASNTISLFIDNIKENDMLNVSILSITGVLLKTVIIKDTSAAVQVDVSSFKPGTYLIRAMSADKILYKKFIKEN